MGVSMKNKGFSLIELLAVLIILAIISVITIPNVLTSLNNTKEQTLLRSADNLIKTAELKFLDSIFQGYHSTYEEGILTSGEELSFKGKVPDYLSINVNDEGRVSIAMWDNSINKCVVKGYDDTETRFEVATDYVECMSYAGTTIVVLFTQVTDTNPGVICSDTTTEDYANNSTCYIRSIEDLVQLSELAKTNNFSTKTIYLEASLDFENDLSYINPNTTVFGDINGNSIIEPLKTELTTGAGFLPIGNNTVYFSGSFNGNMNILQNLYINRNVAYVGLFGRTSAATIEGLNVNNYTITGLNYTGLIGYASSISTIKGLNLVDGNVVGNDYVGSAIGYMLGSSTLATAVNVIGDVTGNNYVGGAIGYVGSSSIATNIVANSNVTGLDSVGGITGSTYGSVYSGTLNNSIYIGGSVTDTDATGYFNRMIGRGASSSMYANEDILVNGATVASSISHGTNIKESHLTHISFYNTVLDTYSGGDNDGDGYYFDYDIENNLVATNVVAPISLIGSGTTEDPYLIYNYNDLKRATYDLTKVYKLMNNIDLLNRKTYPFGNGTDYFTGKFDGDGYTLSNMTIYGANYTGLFGRLAGATVEGLNVNNFVIEGLNYTGLIGYASSISTIKGLNLVDGNVVGNDYVGSAIGYMLGSSTLATAVNVIGDVTGNNYVGGAIGYVGSSSIATNIVANSNVTGLDSVGGITGSTYGSVYSGTLNNSIYIGGSVTDTDATGYFNRMIGRGASSSIYANEDILVNGATVASSISHGTNAKASHLTHVSFFNTVLDTYAGGDNDSDGYYFDYNNENNLVVTKAVLPISLIGAGTTEDPYLIYTYNDLKKATYDLTKSYKLMSDIDLTNRKTYPFGNGTDYFTGKFDGNGYTFSNMVIYGANYTGLFGRLSGATVEGINVNNFVIEGLNYTGLIGYASSISTIKGLNLVDGNVVGNDYVGSAIGYMLGSSTLATAVNVIGDVTGNNYVGGAIGYVGSSSIATNIVANSNVTGLDSVGGITGSTYGSVYSGTLNNSIYIGGSVTDTDATGYFNRMIGRGASSSIYANEDILVNGATVASSISHGTNAKASHLTHISFYDTVVDTYVGGDNDSDGYYFDYDNSDQLFIFKPDPTPTFVGLGTNDNPYLLYNYEDLVKATYDLTKSYKLMYNIDLLNKKIYPFGNTLLSFTGKFDGNGYTLSNLEIYGTAYTGLFGRLSGATVEGLNINNYTIIGANYTGLIGHATSSSLVKGLNLNNGNITGASYVGSVIGYISGSANMINVSASTVNGSSNYVGGVIGFATLSTATVKDIIFDGNVTGNTYVAGLIGYRNSGINSGFVNASGSVTGVTSAYRVTSNTGPTSAYSNDAVLLNGSTVVSTSATSYNGQDVISTHFSDINLYESIGIDTFIGGDNDSDGYYLDYDGSMNINVVKASSPVITMAGSGTSLDPYIILTSSQLKEVSYNLSSHYRLANNLNLNSSNLPMISSDQNRFTGNFDGNGMTISNFNIYGTTNLGLFGYVGSSATIEDLTISNFIIKGYGRVGFIGSSVSSTIRGINLNNGEITGDQYLGSAIGYLSGGTISDINSTSVISATGSYVGGVIGYAIGSPVTHRLVFNGNVTGATYVTGVVGYRGSGTNSGFVNRGGNVTGTTTVNRVTSYTGPTSAIANNTILVNGVTVTSTSLTSYHGQDKTPADLLLQNTYTAIGFNFTDTTPGTYIWRISGSDIWVERN
jgi:prepilin-type N-terminal cleavage/methylation domain-containing protein